MLPALRRPLRHANAGPVVASGFVATHEAAGEVFAEVIVPNGMPIPNAGDEIDVPDLTVGANYVHQKVKVTRRWFIYGYDNGLQKVVLYC